MHLALEGGVTHELRKGDAMLVPPNTPHWYKQIDSTVTCLEARFIAPAQAAAGK